MAGTTGVFTQDGIPFVMQPVLDGPVTAVEGGQGGSIRLRRAKAGNGQVGFLADFTGTFVGLMAVDLDDLLQARKA